ncbi:MAG TPA: PP2C family protein-serine/threonine phosphatase [Tepidisphaeraceae bacterium]|nr:PP2C family protein-serine/threonine phosphatase [Tepidisphaeraceae bacterium]
MTLQFLDTSGNRRIAIFSEAMSLIAEGEDSNARDLHRSLVGLMRRVFEVACYVEVSTQDLEPGEYRITRIWREDGSEGVPDHSPWQITGIPVRRGGIIAQIIEQGRSRAVNQLTIPSDDPVFEELGTYRSVAASPGGMGQDYNWVLTFLREPDAFTPHDLEQLTMRVNLIGLVLKHTQTLGELRRAKAAIDAEVDRIADIQRSLLPSEAPNVTGLEVAARFETFNRAGGDMYDHVRLPGGKWGFLIADASGHGPSAAVVSAMLNAILYTLPAMESGTSTEPAAALRFANTQLTNRRIEQSFVTAFLANWDPHKRTLTYSRAGHNPPLLRRGKTIIALDAVGDLPLGVLEETNYSQYTQILQSGDVVVMFTDGISEAVNSAGEMFGDEQLTRSVINATGTAEQILESIWSAVSEHGRGAMPRDDQTVLVIRVK